MHSHLNSVFIIHIGWLLLGFFCVFYVVIYLFIFVGFCVGFLCGFWGGFVGFVFFEGVFVLFYFCWLLLFIFSIYVPMFKAQ